MWLPLHGVAQAESRVHGLLVFKITNVWSSSRSAPPAQLFTSSKIALLNSSAEWSRRAAANSLLDLVQLHRGGLGPLFLEAPNDVVELGHHRLIRSSTPIPD